MHAVSIERSAAVGEHGAHVLGATARPPERWSHATAAGTAAGWQLTVLPLDEPDRGIDVARAVLEEISALGGGPVTWWTHPSAPRDDHATDGRDEALADALGMVRTRELYELARDLPLDASDGAAAVRLFVPGADDDALLAVNNRAFAWHPDQAGWDRDRIAAAMAEGDLVPDDVLLHEADGEVAAFCWTKVHPGRDPVEGEIFVIGVDPDHQGAGLGRALTVAGLDHLHRVHHAPIGMLYVESTNAPALALYERLGFEHRRTLRCYERVVAG